MQPSIRAGEELMAYARCPMLRKIAGPMQEFRVQRTLEFMVGDIKQETAIHPRYLHFLDRWKQRRIIQSKDGDGYRKLMKHEA